MLMPAGVANQLVRTLADVLIKAAQSFEPAPVEGGVSRRVSSLPEPHTAPSLPVEATSLGLSGASSMTSVSNSLFRSPAMIGSAGNL
jgi:hypothetical protein